MIPPWNFPLAIPCGMTAAALVTGNVVALKPAEQTPLIAGRLAAILHEAGVPAAALICLPGTGEVAGSALAGSPRVDMVAFTGSRAVGTLLFKQGAEVRPARGGLRHTLAEMGGKNPIVVFPDADLDEAVIAILRSAFGHANQKCSAASRVLIHAEIFDRLGRRLVEGARSLPAGPADDPSTLIPPLIDAEARARVAAAAAAARREGTVLLDDLDRPPAPATGPMLVEIGRRRAATARTTQEEIFGPVLALTPFRTLDEAVALANGTPYALTAGVFSRAPGTVRAMIGRLAAGNVYVNRPTTGARVGVEPFGGHKLSGTGPKAGGAEYLWAFVRRGEPRPGGALAAGDERIDADAVAPWPAGPGERAAILREAFAAVADQIDPGSIAAVAALLDRVEEIAAPQPTVAIPGQQTSVDWRTPRGCGLVLVDEGATTADLLALIAAALLAGNGLVILPDRARRPLAGDLLAALRRAGLPGRVACLAPEQVDFAALAALPALTFAAVDAGFEATHALGRLLAAASATPESPHLKALLTLADGPGPDEPGFLRRFALPKTVAVRTLHLGADLDMEIEASESVGGQ